MVEENVNLSKFIFKKQLGICPYSKKVYLLGNFTGSDNKAILILEKTPFSDTDIPGILQEARSPKLYFHNDIYFSFCHFPDVTYSGIKTTLIYPATDQLIKKYTPEANVTIEESYKVHVAVTKPYISQKYSSVEWVYNILEHKSELERIIYEDSDAETGFVLLPDLKWDGTILESFYVQAIPHVRSLKTLRDLSAQHLPLLRKIALLGPKAIEEKYKILKNQLLIYLHYLPSYYHLHIHFKLTNSEGNSGSGCERAHLLNTVIQNIELCPDYYQKATLLISLKKSDELFEKLSHYDNVSANGGAASAEVL